MMPLCARQCSALSAADAADGGREIAQADALALGQRHAMLAGVGGWCRTDDRFQLERTRNATGVVRLHMQLGEDIRHGDAEAGQNVAAVQCIAGTEDDLVVVVRMHRDGLLDRIDDPDQPYAVAQIE